MKSKMNKDLSITMKSENDLEKHIIELGKLIRKDSESVKKTIKEMNIGDMLYCKITLQFLLKLFTDELGFLPTMDIGE